MAVGALQDNPSLIPFILADGGSSHGLTWEQLEAIANGDHIDQPLITLAHADEETYLAELLESYDAVPGLTVDSLEDLQAIAQIIIANPRAFEALVGAHDGTEVIQGEDLTGDLSGGVTAEDFAGFQSQDRLRQLIGHLSGDIDSITNGEIDGDISAQDFATFIVEQPDLPAELKDLLNQAIDAGLTDTGGWEKIQSAFETAGVVVGGLTLLAIPGGNVVVLGGLAATGLLLGAGEALAAHQNGDSEALAWALIGSGLDAIDITGATTAGGNALGILAFIGKLDLPDEQLEAFEVILKSNKLRDLSRNATRGSRAWSPTDAAEYYNSTVDELVAAGFTSTEAERLARGHLASFEGTFTHPDFDEAAFEIARQAQGSTVASRQFLSPNGTVIDQSSIQTRISEQKQARHLTGTPQYKGGSYFHSAGDAQRVLNAFHNGSANVLGVTKGNHIVVEVPAVTGFNNNALAGYLDQPTNIFLIKGSSSPSIVPTTPGWTP